MVTVSIGRKRGEKDRGQLRSQRPDPFHVQTPTGHMLRCSSPSPIRKNQIDSFDFYVTHDGDRRAKYWQQSPSAGFCTNLGSSSFKKMQSFLSRRTAFQSFTQVVPRTHRLGSVGANLPFSVDEQAVDRQPFSRFTVAEPSTCRSNAR